MSQTQKAKRQLFAGGSPNPALLSEDESVPLNNEIENRYCIDEPIVYNLGKQVLLKSVPEGIKTPKSNRTKFVKRMNKELNSYIIENESVPNIPIFGTEEEDSVLKDHIIKNAGFFSNSPECESSFDELDESFESETQTDVSHEEDKGLLGAIVCLLIDVCIHIYVIDLYRRKENLEDFNCDIFTFAICILYQEILETTSYISNLKQHPEETVTVDLEHAIDLIFEESNAQFLKKISADKFGERETKYQLPLSAVPPSKRVQESKKGDYENKITLYVSSEIFKTKCSKRKVLNILETKWNSERLLKKRKKIQSKVLKSKFTNNLIYLPLEKQWKKLKAVVFIFPTEDYLRDLKKNLPMAGQIDVTIGQVYGYNCKLSGWNVFFTWPQHPRTGGDNQAAAEELAQDLQILSDKHKPENFAVILLLNGVSNMEVIKPGNVVPIRTVKTADNDGIHRPLLPPKWPVDLRDHTRQSFADACEAEIEQKRINDPETEVEVTGPSDCFVTDDFSSVQEEGAGNPEKLDVEVVTQSLALFRALSNRFRCLGLTVGVAKSAKDTLLPQITLCQFVRMLCVSDLSKVFCKVKMFHTRTITPKLRGQPPPLPQSQPSNRVTEAPAVNRRTRSLGWQAPSPCATPGVGAADREDLLALGCRPIEEDGEKESAEDLEKLITRNRVLLKKRLDVSALFPHLEEKGMLQIREKQDINSKTSTKDKADALLDLLSQQGKCTIRVFKEILRCGNHEHIVRELK